MQTIKTVVTTCNFVYYGRFIGDYIHPTNKFKMAIYNGEKRFFMGRKNSNFTQSYSAAEICIGVFEISLQFAFHWNEYLLTTFLYGVLPLTYFYSVKRFQVYLSTEVLNPADYQLSRRETSFQENVMKHYDYLQSLTDVINTLWSGTVFLWLVERTIIMINISNAVSLKDTLRVVYYFTETAFSTISLILMAEGCRIVRNFCIWL